jgi:tight adherence protein B
MNLLIFGVIFVLLFALVMLAVSAGVKYLERERKKRVENLLHTATGLMPLPEARILSASPEEAGNGLGRTLSELPLLKGLQKQIWQAGLDWTSTGLVLGMAGCGLLGGLLGLAVPAPVFREATVLALAGVFGVLPYSLMRFKRRRRLWEFEEQFPDALDFLCRSLRAGHAFSVSLEMMGDESPEPLAGEFRRVFHEQNLGAPIEDALRNLTERMPLLDVRFFVSSVLLQRETGGNLAEILTKLAYVIRERFRLKGQVRAVSAHGRLTAGILTAMPIATAIGLMMAAPDYLRIMARDPDGKRMIAGAIAGQLVGYYFIRRIVNIKV